MISLRNPEGSRASPAPFVGADVLMLRMVVVYKEEVVVMWCGLVDDGRCSSDDWCTDHK